MERTPSPRGTCGASLNPSSSWEAIPADMVRRSFLKYGISNAMDGSEDDALYSDLVSGDGSENF